MRTNIPVPDGPVAPRNVRWAWWIAPPAAITLAYRAIPARGRGLWNPHNVATSHLALASIRAGGGWASFFKFARPSLKDGKIWIVDP